MLQNKLNVNDITRMGLEVSVCVGGGANDPLYRSIQKGF